MLKRTAMTLIELVVVLVVLVALSGLLVPLFTGSIQNAQQVSTQQTLNEIRDALMDYWGDTKLIAFDGMATVATESNRFDVDWLFTNPVTGDTTFGFSPETKIGWRGPYIAESTGDLVAAGSAFLIDAWNTQVVIQDVNSASIPRDVRVVSAGPDGSIDIPAGTATSALTASDIGDDIYVAITLR